MNIKLDENVPLRLSERLQDLGHEAYTVPQEGLAGQSDSQIWEAAQRENEFLITQDLDFSDIRKFAPGTHAGLLLIRLRSPGRQALMDRVLSVFEQESVEEWKRCFVVATEHKVRVRR